MARDQVWFSQLVRDHEERQPGQGLSELDRAIARMNINLERVRALINERN